MNIELDYLVYPECPECGSQPNVATAQWGYAYYVICDRCLSEGGTRNFETTPSAAMSHWPDKVLNKPKRETTL